MVNLVEDLLLVAIKPDGGWLGGGFGPEEALGAAALAQLVIDGIVTITGDRIESVESTSLPAELAPTMTEGAALADVVAGLGPLAKEHGLVGLEQRGILTVSRKKFLGFAPTMTIVVHDNGPRDAVLARIKEFADGAKMAEPVATTLLVEILDATGLLPLVLPIPPEALHERIAAADQFAKTEPILDEVKRSIEQVRAAVFTSVLLPAAIRRF